VSYDLTYATVSIPYQARKSGGEMKNYCINHIANEAHYVVGKRFFGSCCREEAYRAASKESVYNDKDRQEFEFHKRRPVRRKDTAVQEGF
jgi:L-amino acid N-acyltransferase YncA